jgi:hypothetical protein
MNSIAVRFIWIYEKVLAFVCLITKIRLREFTYLFISILKSTSTKKVEKIFFLTFVNDAEHDTKKEDHIFHVSWKKNHRLRRKWLNKLFYYLAAN